jgi:hypothetical protein
MVVAAPLDFKSNPSAKMFKTIISNEYEKGANFAGHYSFVLWGCGSPCQSSLLVDHKTGKIYDGVSASLGYSFRKSSQLIITNPKNEDGSLAACGGCKERRWLWNEDKKVFEELTK